MTQCKKVKDPNATEPSLFLPYNIRSSALIDLYPKLYLIGGVSCSNNIKVEQERKCWKTEKSLAFKMVKADHQVFGEWNIIQEKLSTPRSSHLVILAPISSFAECNTD